MTLFLPPLIYARFAERDLVLALGTLLVIGSVLLQGLTLRRVVGRAGLADPGEHKPEEQTAREAMQDAADAPNKQNGNSFDAARQELVRLREENKIGDEVRSA